MEYWLKWLKKQFHNRNEKLTVNACESETFQISKEALLFLISDRCHS